MPDNNGFYKKYKNTRDTAWNVLIDFNIQKLPVSIMLIAKKMGIEIIEYSEENIPDMIDFCGLTDIALANRAISLYTDKWTIFYHALTPKTDIRYHLAHEIGHLLLGHRAHSKKVGYFTAFYTPWNNSTQSGSSIKPSIETEASQFAVRLLSPVCVLRELSAISKDEIKKLCGLPDAEALEREKRIKTLLERNSFMLSGLERRVMDQFTKFISDYKK